VISLSMSSFDKIRVIGIPTRLSPDGAGVSLCYAI
jgi:hypothetical protein